MITEQEIYNHKKQLKNWKTIPELASQSDWDVKRLQRIFYKRKGNQALELCYKIIGGTGHVNTALLEAYLCNQLPYQEEIERQRSEIRAKAHAKAMQTIKRKKGQTGNEIEGGILQE
jgi:hypothetical protein